MILKIWIDKPRGMLLVEEDIPHRGGGVCWTPLRTWLRADRKMKENWLKPHKVKTTDKMNRLRRRRRKCKRQLTKYRALTFKEGGAKQKKWHKLPKEG